MDDTNNCMFKELCKNFEGGYNCSCREGYNLSGDGKGNEGCIPRHKKHHQLLAGIVLAGNNIVLLSHLLEKLISKMIS